MDVRQVLSYHGDECAPLRPTHPPSSGMHTDASLDKSDLHKDATLHKSGMHTHAALDESDRQSVITGLWQFSDREELHEAGGCLPPPKSSSSESLPPPDTSSSGNLHLRIPPEVYLRHLSRQQVIWINSHL